MQREQSFDNVRTAARMRQRKGDFQRQRRLWPTIPAPSPKGSNSSAQGNALGFVPPTALKGRHSQRIPPFQGCAMWRFWLPSALPCA